MHVEEVVERLRDLLRRHAGNVSAVARELNKAPVQVRRWCKRVDIALKSYRR